MSASRFSWQEATPSRDNTHHILANGEPLYKRVFLNVLAYHQPGVAPVQDSSGSYHINERGEPMYTTRFTRTFGFYEGFASVIDQSGQSFHISTDGNCSYSNSRRRFDWCGNFQQKRCVVRAAATSKTGKNEYFHIGTDGEFIEGGPYEYAGDYREGYAVVRSASTGLCFHVDLNGKKIYDHQGFLDLDVFHKGYARAKDGNGWFHIDTTARDISRGARYAEMEPFYNGMAYAKQSNGERVVINENYEVATKLKNPESEVQDYLHSLCVAFWPSFALKLGLEMGLADETLTTLSAKLPVASFNALLAAWLELGLLTTIGEEEVVLSEKGKRLKSGLDDRYRANYWLGLQMTPWLEAASRFHSPPSKGSGNAFFDTLSEDSVDLLHRALVTYAQDDWKEVVDHIDFSAVKTVVDIGGGFGYLANSIRANHSNIDCYVVEKHDVVAATKKYETATNSGVQFVVGDLFSGNYPAAEIYILSRVLHDWSDPDVRTILLHLKASLPPSSTLIVIERIKSHQSSHGLLQLNMLLTTGGTERTEAEFEELFSQTGWQRTSTSFVNANCAIMTVSKRN